MLNGEALMSNAVFWALITAGILFVAVAIVLVRYYWIFVIAPAIERGFRVMSRGIGNDES